MRPLRAFTLIAGAALLQGCVLAAAAIPLAAGGVMASSAVFGERTMQALVEANVLNGVIQLRTRIHRQYTIGRKHHSFVCRIDIIGNGPGIPTDMIENIFYPMISGRAEGTGLGLTISQHLIHQHHGLIECQSEPGKTRFSLYLPMEAQHAEV